MIETAFQSYLILDVFKELNWLLSISVFLFTSSRVLMLITRDLSGALSFRPQYEASWERDYTKPEQGLDGSRGLWTAPFSHRLNTWSTPLASIWMFVLDARSTSNQIWLLHRLQLRYQCCERVSGLPCSFHAFKSMWVCRKIGSSQIQ